MALAVVKAARPIECALCLTQVRFATVTELIAHYRRKHDDYMSAEVDRMQIEQLDRDHKRRVIRDADVSAIVDKRAS